MGKLRIVTVPAAIALIVMGSADPPRARVSGNESGPLQPVIRPAGDFNGDGFSDLAVGVPFEDVGGAEDAGAVNVLYGSATGLAAAGNQYWTQNSPGLGDVAERSDQFGFASTAGDFNGDGFSDLAVGAPLEDGPEDSGSVNVIYGSANGLTATGSQVWTQNSPGIPGSREVGDKFGRALVAGDFNHDGASDLAVGVPYERVGRRSQAGAVNVLYGSPTGLTSAGARVWTQNSSGIKDSAETGDLFGYALSASDFNGDTFADLAVGIPGEDPKLDSGAVAVIYGSANGLTSARNQFWTQNSSGIRDSNESNDLFGYCLAAGDFDDDGFADLAVGVPFEDIGKGANAGAVSVIYGSGTGLVAAGNQFWSQNTPGILNAAEGRDELGFAVAVDDFNGDGSDDLAIGIPGEDPPREGGSVAVIFGGPPGLSAAGNELWSQDRLGGGRSEVADNFGMSLAAGRFGNSAPADLAIGVPSEDVVTKTDAGAMNVAYGSPEGLQAEGSQFWTQDDLAGPAERGDRFGYGMGAHPP
jgi:FG-GAP repeat protein